MDPTSAHLPRSLSVVVLLLVVAQPGRAGFDNDGDDEDGHGSYHAQLGMVSFSAQGQDNKSQEEMVLGYRAPPLALPRRHPIHP